MSRQRVWSQRASDASWYRSRSRTLKRRRTGLALEFKRQSRGRCRRQLRRRCPAPRRRERSRPPGTAVAGRPSRRELLRRRRGRSTRAGGYPPRRPRRSGGPACRRPRPATRTHPSRRSRRDFRFAKSPHPPTQSRAGAAPRRLATHRFRDHENPIRIGRQKFPRSFVGNAIRSSRPGRSAADSTAGPASGRSWTCRTRDSRSNKRVNRSNGFLATTQRS